MVKKSISGLDLNEFDRIIITIVKAHCEQYESDIILKQAFESDNNNKIEICMLPGFTSCQSETVYETIRMMDIEGEFVVKDSDNYISLPSIPHGNYIVGLDVNKFDKEINRLSSKSFLVVNEQDVITDIVEKKIKSDHICLGMYGFSDTKEYSEAYLRLSSSDPSDSLNEIYISHVISYMIGTGGGVFKYVESAKFEDWGTMQDWQLVQDSMRTYFIDLDGVVFNNRGKYGSKNWSNDNEPIMENVDIICKLYKGGAQIVVTTSRGDNCRHFIQEFFASHGIELHAIVTGCNHAGRIIINDFAPSNAYPSCQAISLPRNSSLSGYLRL